MKIAVSKRNAKKHLMVALVNIAVLIVMIISIETISSYFTTKPNGYMLPDFRLNHKSKANYTSSTTMFSTPDFPQPIVSTTNSQDWKEKENVKIKKKSGTFRIFYVGDSFTLGTCNISDTLPSIVKRELDAVAGNKGPIFEVINTGTQSYSPTLYYILIRYVLLDYKPDLIVVNIDLTDVHDDWKYNHTLIKDEEGNPYACPPRDIFSSDYIDAKRGAVRATWWRKAQLFLYQNSYSFNLIQQLRNRYFHNIDKAISISNAIDMTDNDPYQRFAWCLDKWDAITQKNVANSMDILKRLAVLCKQRNMARQQNL